MPKISYQYLELNYIFFFKLFLFLVYSIFKKLKENKKNVSVNLHLKFNEKTFYLFITFYKLIGSLLNLLNEIILVKQW